MLNAGLFGVVFLGNIQDKQIDRELQKQNPAIHAKAMGNEKASIFGKYKPLDHEKVSDLSSTDKAIISDVQTTSKQSALSTVAIFPGIMLISYLGMIFYFRSRGGYKPIELSEENSSASQSKISSEEDDSEK